MVDVLYRRLTYVKDIVLRYLVQAVGAHLGRGQTEKLITLLIVKIINSQIDICYMRTLITKRDTPYLFKFMVQYHFVCDLEKSHTFIDIIC